MEITINYLMSRPYMNNAELLNGDSLEDKTVRQISFLERLSKHIVIFPNVLVFTDIGTVSLIPVAEWKRLMKAYSNARVSGICIRLNVNESFPFNYLQIATANAIPIIALPEDTSMSMVMSGVDRDIAHAEGYDESSTYTDNFVQEILFTENDPKMVKKRLRMMGVRVDEFLCAILIRPDSSMRDTYVAQVCNKIWGNDCFVSSKNGSALLIGRTSAPYENADEDIEYRTLSLDEKLRDFFPKVSFSIGIGHIYKNLANIRDSYYSARTALIAASSDAFGKKIVAYDDLGIYKILYDLKNRELLREFYDETIGMIQRYDDNNQTEYLKTIKVFLKNSGSVQKSANELFIQYNTIRYRMRKIQALFGYDLQNLEDCGELQIALNVGKFLTDESGA